MEKLQPLIVHRFWILVGVALLLPLVGWWMGAGNLAAEIDQRRETLDGIAGKSYTESPNSTWIKELQQVNEQQSQSNDQSAAQLWQNQRKLMVWPDSIRHLVQQDDYFGEIASDALAIYSSDYRSLVRKLYEIVDPFTPRTYEHGKVVVDGYGERDGVISVRGQVIHQVPEGTWQNRTPTSKEIWEAQEDIWLVTALLESVARVNQGDANLLEAGIKKLERLSLHGGRPRDEAPAAGGTDSGGYDMGGSEMGPGSMPMMGPGGGMPPGMGMDGGPGMGPGGGYGGNQMGGGGRSQAAFNPAEEFGDDTAPATMTGGEDAGSAGGYEDAGLGPVGMSPMGPGAQMSGGMGLGMGGMGRNQQKKRYIRDDPDLPYKTRGFYLQVTMDERKLPELLVRLTNCAWPVRITRVQMALVDQDGISPRSGGMGGYPGMGGPGMGGPGMGGSGMGGSGMGGYPGMGGEYDAGGESFPGMGGSSGSGLGPGLDSFQPTMPSGSGLGSPSYQTGNRTGGNAYQQVLSSAMSQPYLAQVALTGIITVYQPPEDEESPENTMGDSAAPGTPALEEMVDSPDQNAVQPETTVTPPDTPAEPGNTPPALGTPGANGAPQAPAPSDGGIEPPALDGSSQNPATETGASPTPDGSANPASATDSGAQEPAPM